MWTGTFPDVLTSGHGHNPPGCPSPCPANPSCPWFVPELERWVKKKPLRTPATAGALKIDDDYDDRETLLLEAEGFLTPASSCWTRQNWTQNYFASRFGAPGSGMVRIFD